MTLPRVLTATALVVLLTASGCVINAVQQKQDYVENVELRLRQVSVRITQLKFLHAESRESGLSEIPELSDTLSQLGEKQEVAARKLDQVKHASVANWKDVKSTMDAVLDDLEWSCEVAAVMLEEALLEMDEQGLDWNSLLVSLPQLRPR
ncbi:MAG TPA: hypothetical protein PLP42_13565 [Acidobacteriota bacterium]|nr:hypothetical protein [Acidobacteriota bacterium]